MYKRICLNCGKEFEMPTWANAYCSEECRKEGEREVRKKASIKKKVKERYEEHYRKRGDQALPTLDKLTEDELLHYGKTQAKYYGGTYDAERTVPVILPEKGN